MYQLQYSEEKTNQEKCKWYTIFFAMAMAVNVICTKIWAAVLQSNASLSKYFKQLVSESFQSCHFFLLNT